MSRLSLFFIVGLSLHTFSTMVWGAANRDIVKLIIDVQNFHRASSVIFVDYMHDNDMAFRNLVIDTIREFSKNFVMTQTIPYDTFQSAMHSFIENQNIQARTPLYTLFVPDNERFSDFKNLAKNIDMSLNPWFVIVNNGTDLDCENPRGNPFDLTMDTRMIVKCQNTSKVMKYYSIIVNSTDAVELGSWTAEDGLQINNDDNVLHLRKNMKGITLKIALHVHSPYDHNQNLPHFLESIIQLLAGMSNFKTQVVVEHDLFGYYNFTTKQWSGLMRSMAEKEADIAMVLMTMSNDRRKAVDFSMPLLRARCKLYMRIPENTHVYWSAYFKVFCKRTWIIIGLLILALSVLLGVTKSRTLHFKANSLTENLLGIWGVYCQQGISEIPSNRPTRILYFSSLISALVLYAIYSATITSYIAVLTTNLPFSNYEEFLKSRDYGVILIQGSRDELLVYSNDWLLSPLHRHLMDKSLWPTNPYEGFMRICENENQLALYTNEFYFKSADERTLCPIGSLRMARIENQVIVLAKNSPYTETLNYYIMKLMDHGIINRMKNKYFYQDTVFFDSPPKVMTLWEVMPILSIWAAGTLASLILLCLEIMYKQCFPSRQRDFGFHVQVDKVFSLLYKLSIRSIANTRK